MSTNAKIGPGQWWAMPTQPFEREQIKIQPDYYQAWYHRGLVLRTLKRYEAALASYNKVIEIKGHNLTHEIKTGAHWQEAQVIGLVEDILKILNFVHQNDVIHRDIKPANIMRRRKDRKIVLIDFGGVKQVIPPSPQSWS